MTPQKSLLRRFCLAVQILAAFLLAWTPPPSQAEDLVIYDDELNADWENWSWDATVDFANVDPVHLGTHALSARFTAAWAGLYLHSNRTLDNQDYRALRFWIHGGLSGGQSIATVLIDVNKNEVSTRFDLPALDVNTWTEARVPLSVFGAFSGISGFFWQDMAGAPQPVFYLDQIVLEGAGAAPPQPTPTPIASPTPQTPGVVRDKWDLWLNGPHLRGANILQRHVHPDLDGPTFLGPGPVGPPFTQEDFDRLAALGANYVNISYSGLYSETPPYVLDPDVQDGLDQLLDMIAKADMFAVISFRSGPGRSEFALYYWDGLDTKFFNDSMWQDQAAQDAWVEMWRYAAQRYRDNPIVVGYDLMVEPNSNDSGSDALNNPLDIWDPEEFYSMYGGTLYDWNQLYPRITMAIREVDTKTPILIAGNSYSGVRWLPYLQPTGDPLTVYAVHQYEPQAQYTHKDFNEDDFQKAAYPGVFDVNSDGIDDQFNRAWLDNFLSTIDAFKAKHNVPVAVNEYGIVRWVNNAADFMRDQMDLFEQRGLNYALWEWQPSWEPLTEENNAFNFLHGPDPDSHTEVSSSDLIEVIRQFWGRNTIRPSTMAAGVMEWPMHRP